MVKKNADGTYNVICEHCNCALSDYVDRRASLPTTADKASELAWYYGFNTQLERCSYCV